ncbi:TetR/AcrR family transcriptional regulator [Leucobacter sp. W1153]|uniref:TetR/AcrR family transcriptional regulator n=1 Tax=unclassified Leucobacter TaxID=2621730 RepID=UPI003F362C7F
MRTLTPAPDRLLDTASTLFAREGIRSIGIDRILSEAGVAKATMYQAFGSKEALIVAYLERRDATDRQAYRAHTAKLRPGVDHVLASFDLAERAALAGNFTGCIYANALNEFPDPELPIAAAVRSHRDWVREQWLNAIGERESGEALADQIQILYDGCLLGTKVARTVAPITLARNMARDLIEVTRTQVA